MKPHWGDLVAGDVIVIQEALVLVLRVGEDHLLGASQMTTMWLASGVIDDFYFNKSYPICWGVM